MSQIKTMFKNMSWILISQIVASICGFIWTILTARYLGVNDYGILGFAISFTGIFSIALDLGISTHIVREISTNKDSAPKYLGNAIPLKSLFSIGTFILILIILIWLKYDELTITITLLFTIEMIINSFKNLINGSFQAFENTKYQGIGTTISNLTLLLFILFSIFTDLGLFGITISYILANVLAIVYEYYVLRKRIIKPKFELDKNFCKNITRLSIPFAIGALFYTIYYSIDMVMLNNLVGSYATGIYNATYKLISVLTIFYTAYGAIIFPIMSKFYKNDEKLLSISFEKSMKYLMLIIIPIAIGTSIYSLNVIQFIYGYEYDAASSVLSILIWTVCLLFANGVFGNLLNASHYEVTVTKIYIFAAIFNVVLNLVMIPNFSYIGAAISTVFSDILILIIESYILYKIGFKVNKKLFKDLGKIILGSILLGVILYFLNLNMWIALFAGTIIYFTILYLLKLFDDDDKYVIKEILGNNL